METTSRVNILTTVPRQTTERKDKLAWVRSTLADHEDTDLLLLPQEYLGGTVMMHHDRHAEVEWMHEQFGAIAKEHETHIAVGAAVKHKTGGSTEDYLYYDDDGKFLGYHRKFALPRYDDVRADGAGELWPEISFTKRSQPIFLPKLGLVVGTIFCWEVFSTALWSAYGFAGVNLITHPIKFAPRGWLKVSTTGEGKGRKRVVGFGQDASNNIWQERLLAASKFEVMCPIAVTCNTWNLGEKYMALVGHINEVYGDTELHDIPSAATAEYLHKFKINPRILNAFDQSHNPGAYAKVVGGLEGYSEASSFTMPRKMRRLEAHLIGGMTRMTTMMRASVQGRLPRNAPSTDNRTKRQLAKMRRKKVGA